MTRFRPSRRLIVLAVAPLMTLGLVQAVGQSPAPAVPVVSYWEAVAAGQSFTCGIKDGPNLVGGTLWCWGRDNVGQVGDGDKPKSPIPAPRKISTNAEWTEVSAGWYHACAVRRSGTLWCWGYNGHGQLGVGSTTNKLSPVQVGSSSSWWTVSAGTNHTCAIKVDGSLWCWGNDQYGQVGNGPVSSKPRLTPAKVGTALTWSKISVGESYACGVQYPGGQSSSLWCWGSAEVGGLGIGTNPVDQHSPAQVTASGDTNWGGGPEVAAGGHTTCATKKVGGSAAVSPRGQLWCWGSDEDQQLGDGGSTTSAGTDRYSPKQVGASLVTPLAARRDWRFVSVGPEHACASETNLRLYCWGRGQYGQLGNGDTAVRSVPTLIGSRGEPATFWVGISAGFSHTCAIESDNNDPFPPGTLACWGDNSYGQLADGSKTNRLVPTTVVG